MAKKASSKAEVFSALFKILADKNRCGAIMQLAQARRGIAVGDLADSLDMSQSATSHLLANLYEEGIVTSKRDGRVVTYMLAAGSQAKAMARLLKAARG